MGSSVGVKNNVYAVLVMGVYEILVEYNFNKANYKCVQFLLLSWCCNCSVGVLIVQQLNLQ